MRLKQDGEVGRGRLRGVEGECRGDEAGGGMHAMVSRGPPDEEASRVSLSSGKSVWGNMSHNNINSQTKQMFTTTGGIDLAGLQFLTERSEKVIQSLFY